MQIFDRDKRVNIRDMADQVRAISRDLDDLCRECEIISGLEMDRIERLEALKASRKKGKGKRKS